MISSLSDGITGHVPVRPSWCCAYCEQPWPCQPARVSLTDEYRNEPGSVARYLCTQMHHAVADLDPTDLPGLTPAVFYARFLAWVRPDDPR